MEIDVTVAMVRNMLDTLEEEETVVYEIEGL